LPEPVCGISDATTCKNLIHLSHANAITSFQSDGPRLCLNGRRATPSLALVVAFAMQDVKDVLRERALLKSLHRSRDIAALA
jgi:hypothetical protein